MGVKTKVIAIGAVSGGGKTSVSKELNKELPSSHALFFDDYSFEGAPDDLVKWVQQGPDYNQWNVEPLLIDIQSLLTAKETPSYIILDYPFAYKNDILKSFIDLAVYIDTPLDIAMARRMLRDHKNSSASDIHNDAGFYLEKGRQAYVEMIHTIKPNSDLIIEGTLPLYKIVNVIVQELD
ncbi:hypothetical protein LF817_09450 [Halobacillus sp. A1]|uniref:hypothetical protein n=1 Tax=Halobacillus sp. A1 TaxID=2880262 RepID=UPI0020A668FB|nr:hypothetical protein [Halobacillus sp. A1]MCP3031574.1 hypothetical protein [Halobacillus sp. A1]